MRKKALTLSCYICAAGAIGAFIRWLQNQIAINDNKLYNSSPVSYLLGIYILFVFILFIYKVRSLKSTFTLLSTNFDSTFRTSTRLSKVLSYIFCSMLFFGGLYLLISSQFLENKTILLIIAVLAMVSGVSILLCLNFTRFNINLTATSILLLFPIALYFSWTLYTYKINSSNPSIWSFTIEILAVTSTLLAFYYIDGFAFQRIKLFTTIFFLMFSAFLCIVTLADDRNVGMELILAATAGIIILFLWKIIINLNTLSKTET